PRVATGRAAARRGARPGLPLLPAARPLLDAVAAAPAPALLLAGQPRQAAAPVRLRAPGLGARRRRAPPRERPVPGARRDRPPALPALAPAHRCAGARLAR